MPAGDTGSIPGLGRSTRKGIGYPLQYYWASLVVQLVKNPPAMLRPGFSPWAEKIPWRRERLPTPVFWPGEFHGLYSPWVTKSQTQLSDFHFQRTLWGFPGGASGKEPVCQCRRAKSMGSISGSGNPLGDKMATHTSILAWRIPMDRRAWYSP